MKFRRQVVPTPEKWRQKNKKDNNKFNTFINFTRLYHTYLLLYYKEDIQKTSNYNTI